MTKKQIKTLLKQKLESNLYNTKVEFGGNDVILIDKCCNNTNFVITTRLTETHISMLHIYEISGFISIWKLTQIECAFKDVNSAIDSKCGYEEF